MTIVGGVFLLLDLVPHLTGEFSSQKTAANILPFDPAWVTICICGIPLPYLAIWRIIHNRGIRKISSALLICIAMFAAIFIGDLFAAGEADLLPEEKVGNIELLRQQGHVTCMIGDGVNDAPALKMADVSVAMGEMGSDIAVDAADVALMTDDVSKIPYLKDLPNATVRTIKGSIILSMCINAAAIVLSLMELLNPTTGALVHNAGSCLVVLIAALLYDREFFDVPENTGRTSARRSRRTAQRQASSNI